MHLTALWPSGGRLACVLKYCFLKSCFSNLLCYPQNFCCHLPLLAWFCTYPDFAHSTFEALDFYCHDELARMSHLRTSYFSLIWLFLPVMFIMNQKNTFKIKSPPQKYKAKKVPQLSNFSNHKSFSGNILLHLWDLGDYLKVEKNCTRKKAE